ncbi:hypothetical protein AAVH_07582 [Aphelenchoides avenae]|nr:hypothetical protein AAVH_07582 [Aphelenchus avenae]
MVAKQLMLASDAYQTVFQSRFGYDKWLEPDCDKVLSELPTKGVKLVTIIAPGFAADCLETTEEIAIHYRDKFLAAGGETLSYVPALNDSNDHVTLMKDLVQRCTRD